MEASSSNSRNIIYEVFINLGGIDVHNTFLGHLVLSIGNRLDERLEGSIKESRTAIVVLSQNYATSKWCLRELAKIMESMDDGRTGRVLPVFYHVDPHDVPHLSRSFKKSFDEYDEDDKCTKEEVNDGGML